MSRFFRTSLFWSPLADSPGDVTVLEPEIVESTLDLSEYSEAEQRPAQFLYGQSGAAFFDLLDRLENIPDAGTTVLDEVLRGWFLAIYQLSAVSGSAILPENVPDGVRSNVAELGDGRGNAGLGAVCCVYPPWPQGYKFERTWAQARVSKDGKQQANATQVESEKPTP